MHAKRRAASCAGGDRDSARLIANQMPKATAGSGRLRGGWSRRMAGDLDAWPAPGCSAVAGEGCKALDPLLERSEALGANRLHVDFAQLAVLLLERGVKGRELRHLGGAASRRVRQPGLDRLDQRAHALSASLDPLVPLHVPHLQPRAVRELQRADGHRAHCVRPHDSAVLLQQLDVGHPWELGRVLPLGTEPRARRVLRLVRGQVTRRARDDEAARQALQHAEAAVTQRDVGAGRGQPVLHKGRLADLLALFVEHRDHRRVAHDDLVVERGAARVHGEGEALGVLQCQVRAGEVQHVHGHLLP
mmetsp:Transcript_13146/g.27975  ORF Transcript_13146/g.27975 Transcript_13146/m.27975 type:complete len:304 (+) Transcript_13146:521-1432(+)